MGNNSELFFKQSTPANQPTIDSTENAVRFASANSNYMTSNKMFDWANPFVFEFWHKFNSIGLVNQYVMSSWNFGTDNNNYFLIRYQYLLRYLDFRVKYGGVNDTVILENQILVNDTDWHHFLVCSNGVYLSEYTDGKIDRIASLPSGAVANNFPIQVGLLLGIGHYFDGFLDDLSIKQFCPEHLNAYDGSSAKYSVATNEEVFTPIPRKTY